MTIHEVHLYDLLLLNKYQVQNKQKSKRINVLGGHIFLKLNLSINKQSSFIFQTERRF